jgi:hypothetical protein
VRNLVKQLLATSFWLLANHAARDKRTEQISKSLMKRLARS